MVCWRPEFPRSYLVRRGMTGLVMEGWWIWNVDRNRLLAPTSFLLVHDHFGQGPFFVMLMNDFPS